jgi:hypothetical protein
MRRQPHLDKMRKSTAIAASFADGGEPIHLCSTLAIWLFFLRICAPGLDDCGRFAQ